MILEFIQKERIPKAEHEILYNKNIIGSAFCDKFLSGEMNLNNKQYQLKIDNLSSFPIMSNNEQVGYVVQKFNKTGKFLCFDTGYSFYEFKCKNDVFAVYDIGLGKNQHYYQFEKFNKTVAIIHKPDRVVNRKDYYMCYSEDEKMILPMSLWCLFLEASAYYDINVAGEGNVVTNKAYKSQKITREKYDATFISKIKALEGID